jgi:LL-diaminopimelate aminotransferase
MTSQLLQALEPYVFWELDARRARLRARGIEFLDLGIGSPDGPIAPVVIEAIARAAADPMLSRYPHFRGHPDYLEAVVGFMHRRFGVQLDAASETIALAGSKEGYAELVLATVNPGDVVLIPAVHYPVYARAPRLAGARAVPVPLTANGVLDVSRIAPNDLALARMLVYNYPSNPTTAVGMLDDHVSLVAFARRHGVLLVSDLAYSELAFDGYVVPSVLQVEGARDVAVELHSCSKSFNMAGIRIAFAAGQRDALSALDRYRANIGYGVSTLTMRAGEAAFTHAESIVPSVVREYQRRRDTLVSALREHGWDAQAPRATMYQWLPIPGGMDDWEWVDRVLETLHIVVTPGIAFGEAGRGYFRLSYVQPAERLRDAAVALARYRESLRRADTTSPARVP